MAADEKDARPAPEAPLPDDPPLLIETGTGAWREEFEDMEPAERQYVLDELAGRPDLWDESEVVCEY